MSGRKPGKPGDELTRMAGMPEDETDDKSRESKRLPARLYHPQMLDLIESIALHPSTHDRDRIRLMEIVARQRAHIERYGFDIEKVCHLASGNFESFSRQILSEDGAIQRDSMIHSILDFEDMATADTIPPSMPRLQNVTDETSKRSLAVTDAARLETLHKEIYRDEVDNIRKGDKRLIILGTENGKLKPGDLLTVVGVCQDKITMVYLEDEKGGQFSFDLEILEKIAHDPDPFGDN